MIDIFRDNMYFHYIDAGWKW